MDVEGGYWIAGVGGARIYRFDATGELTLMIPVPFDRPTKLAFIGPGLGRLATTSASSTLDALKLDGAVVCAESPVTGQAIPRVCDSRFRVSDVGISITDSSSKGAISR